MTVTPSPKAFAGSDQYVNVGNTVSLNAQGGTHYVWTPSLGLNDPKIPSPSFVAESTVTYFVKVYDVAKNCFTIDEVTIFVDRSIIVPNAITPNGDNNNDSWEITNIERFPNCVVEIYNRWGSLVWTSQGYSIWWDGSNFRNGEALPVGTYFYIIDLKSQEFTKPYTGYIQIIK